MFALAYIEMITNRPVHRDNAEFLQSVPDPVVVNWVASHLIFIHQKNEQKKNTLKWKIKRKKVGDRK